MLCEMCKQNQATIHIQEINNGKKMTLHVCASCAAKKGLGTIEGEENNIAEILYKLSAPLEGENGMMMDYSGHADINFADDVTPAIICPKCKWDMNKFQKTGRLGCENCYQVFSGILSETLRNIHRGVLHIGKRPNIKSSGPNLVMLEILNLQKQLNIHVIREEFEEAAKLRDQINKLKKEMKSKKNG